MEMVNTTQSTSAIASARTKSGRSLGQGWIVMESAVRRTGDDMIPRCMLGARPEAGRP
jgi:hypothetical protein